MQACCSFDPLKHSLHARKDAAITREVRVAQTRGADAEARDQTALFHYRAVHPTPPPEAGPLLGVRPRVLPLSRVPAEARSHFKHITLNTQRLPAAIRRTFGNHYSQSERQLDNNVKFSPSESRNTAPEQQRGAARGKSFFFYPEHTAIVFCFCAAQ